MGNDSSIKQEYSGVILIDKPVGITSFSVDSKIKRILGQKSVGHCGTLDPFASGLLPICVGKSLRVVRYADSYDKKYACTAVFGRKTDTGDNEGETVKDNFPNGDELKALKEEKYQAVLDCFNQISKITTQVPPIYSAKKINGRKAYELAREGKSFTLLPQNIAIRSLNVLNVYEIEVDNNRTIAADFEIECSKGTYIRTICEDVGELFGYGAHAVSLRRLAEGPFSVSDAVSLEELESQATSGDYSFIRGDAILTSHLPTLVVDEVQTRLIKNGCKLDASYFVDQLEGFEEGTRFRAMNEGNLIAVVYDATEEDGHIIRIERMLA